MSKRTSSRLLTRLKIQKKSEQPEEGWLEFSTSSSVQAATARSVAHYSGRGAAHRLSRFVTDVWNCFVSAPGASSWLRCAAEASSFGVPGPPAEVPSQQRGTAVVGADRHVRTDVCEISLLRDCLFTPASIRAKAQEHREKNAPLPLATHHGCLIFYPAFKSKNQHSRCHQPEEAICQTAHLHRLFVLEVGEPDGLHVQPGRRRPKPGKVAPAFLNGFSN